MVKNLTQVFEIWEYYFKYQHMESYPQSFQQSSQEVQNNKLNPKVIAIVALVLIVIFSCGILIGNIFFGNKATVTGNNENSVTTNEINTDISKSPDRQSTQIDIEKDKKQSLIDITNLVTNFTLNKEYENALPYFLYGGYGNLSQEGVIKLLEAQREYLGIQLDESTISSVDLQGQKGQVLLQASGTNSNTAVVNFEFIGDTWKITGIDFNKKLDLTAEKNEQKKTIAIVEQGTFSTIPKVYKLPNGDSFLINRTRFTSLRTEKGTHFDIEVTADYLTRDYTVALYDSARIWEYTTMKKGVPGTYFQAFDIRPLLETRTGLLLFYPEGITINKKQIGKPAGLLHQIPIRIQLVN